MIHSIIITVPEDVNLTVRKQSNPTARIFIDAAERIVIRTLDVFYNIFNSNTNITRLDNLTSAIVRLSQSQGVYGFLNYLYLASNVAQLYGGIIAGIDLKDSKKKYEQDAISGAEVSDRLQSSVDELNDRFAYATDLIMKIAYCRYANPSVGKNVKLKKITKDVCSSLGELMENYIAS